MATMFGVNPLLVADARAHIGGGCQRSPEPCPAGDTLMIRKSQGKHHDRR
jgi:hypothetical protein